MKKDGLPPRQIQIIIPGALPKELSSNWNPRGNANALRFVKVGQISEFNETVYLCAVSSRNKWTWNHSQSWTPIEQAEIEVTIIYTSHMRKMDETNVRAILKHAEDALTMPRGSLKLGAEILRDDSPEHLTWKPIRWERGDTAEIRIDIKEVPKHV